MTMTSEVAILRAYAFASQGKYAEAEQVLSSVPEVLNTPSGADLFARIRFEQGDVETARRIWEELLVVDPSNESARNALAAIDSPIELSTTEDAAACCFCYRFRYACAAVVIVLLGMAFFIGKICGGKAQVGTTPEVDSSIIIAEQSIPVRAINGALLRSLKEGILTNMTDETVLILSGGRGRLVADKVRNLAIIAECLNYETKVPFGKLFIHLNDDGYDELRMLVGKGLVPYKKGKGE